MNIKRPRPAIKKSQLENEVILAVVLLYVLLSAVMLVIHHIQPGNVETATSSTSPAHGELRVDAGIAPAAGDRIAPLNLADISALLERDGYREIRELHAVESFRASAIKDGKTWDLEVDPASGQITSTPLLPN